ncbi:hypothetical protein [Streptomyces sp. NPDC001530]|uniref:T4 family baseplate hub assembly chaperone n=1 Tax=Streptomyces sp. NPDC001530 TaxID=3364582 RepID=UPI0036BF1879
MTALREIPAGRLLAAWDEGVTRPPVARPLALLAAATGDGDETLASLSLGQREAVLLRLREQIFGERITALATCPACSERVEVCLSAAAVLGDSPETAMDPAALTLEMNGYRVDFRLPDSRDAAAAGDSPDVATARQVLLDRCVTVTDRDGRRRTGADVPPDVVAAVVERMAQLDPHADVGLALTCPTCARGWDAPFDAGAFLWSEVETWARRTLRQIHELALAYGWSEAETLGLSERRRQAYLELVGS